MNKRRCLLWCLCSAVSLLSILCFELWSDWLTAVPLDAPFPLDKPSAVEQVIEIRSTDYKYLQVRLARTQDNFQQLMDLVGRDGQPATVQVHWRLLGMDSKVLAQGTSRLGQASGISRDDISCWLATLRYPAPTGHYQLQAQVTVADPAFAGVDTRLVLESSPKNGSDPRFGLMFFWMIFNLLVCWPLAIVGGIAAAVCYLRGRTIVEP
ncbi:hypothetical protein [Pseudomonas sp. RIT-PI-S]|uniref:hypothetical protein n=1 Tax=Pseudomonas sp. RIT-PI-S TaxID=3035295 RepID=UPI0021DA20AC|nr:hypothetical protein [Pseudomonas sp. RIT-PI-S]